ncbi:hypothetical protein I302_106595 [Kwoniella bestiolae CBS 10118]|uniref:Transcription elongation factor Eaf N-terminal domain-containing protein n=1 Tax=Kwoniella bestiolae CBS 10118 TaxID=1296100 RepID=A0AAJ8KBH2_9TREE
MAQSPIPPGTYPIQLSSSINPQPKKRRRDEGEIVAFKYAFKPASITQNTPGQYNVSSGIGGNGQLVFDTNTGIQQVFDVREEHNKARECVLVWDDEAKSFTLHALPSTLHLTLNRSTSRNKAPSVSSSTSSKSIPLAKSNTKPQDDEDDEKESPNREEAETPRPKKKSRPSQAVENRQTKGGKGMPSKKPLESAPIPLLSSSTGTTAKTKSTKKGTTKKPTAARGKGKKAVVELSTPTKFKSSEYIEDSDEEIAASESNAPQEEEVDEFANLLGESLAQGEEYDEDEEEDEESEEEEEDEGLGGARLVVGSAIMDDDGSEWI